MLEVEKEMRLEMVARLKLQFRARRLRVRLEDWSREVVEDLVKEVCCEGREKVTQRVGSILTGLVELITTDYKKIQELPESQIAENVDVKKHVRGVGNQQQSVRQKVWAKGRNGLYGWRMAVIKKPTKSEFKPYQITSSDIQHLSRNAHNSLSENNASGNFSKLKNSICEQPSKRKYESKISKQIKRRRANPEDTGANYWMEGKLEENGSDINRKGL